MDVGGVVKFRGGVESVVGMRRDKVGVSGCGEMGMGVWDILKKGGRGMGLIGVRTGEEEVGREEEECMNEV
ncbi:hypothetical protein, partial [Micrococcus luteus]|uniref:hypothetical protein n=1 Tax=Micrococcus luteus TaxID=1270 RepID=UPI001C92FDB0